ncbi:MAG: type 4a pilus biogenesis protein PilO [Candidatus Omnitrophota bacterium]
MGIKEITKSLYELSKFDINDLQNIDLTKLRDELFQRKDILANVILVTVTIGAVIFLNMQGKANLQELRSNTEKLEEKLTALNEFQAAEKNLAEFTSSLSAGIPNERLISVLNDLAVVNNIQIVAFSPSQKENLNLYELSRIRIDILAKDYTDLWRFVRNIEHAEYHFLVEDLGAQMDSATTGQSNIRASIQIAAILIKK